MQVTVVQRADGERENTHITPVRRRVRRVRGTMEQHACIHSFTHSSLTHTLTVGPLFTLTVSSPFSASFPLPSIMFPNQQQQAGFGMPGMSVSFNAQAPQGQQGYPQQQAPMQQMGYQQSMGYQQQPMQGGMQMHMQPNMQYQQQPQAGFAMNVPGMNVSFNGQPQQQGGMMMQQQPQMQYQQQQNYQQQGQMPQQQGVSMNFGMPGKIKQSAHRRTRRENRNKKCVKFTFSLPRSLFFAFQVSV